jgi:hypothetical protein
MSHQVAPLGHATTLPYAEALLKMYRETARLVITTRLHAALPCIAMGIPVIFFGSAADGRTAIVRDIGGRIYDAFWHRKAVARGLLGRALDGVDWEPAPLDITPVKSRLAAAISRRLGAIERVNG